MHTPDAVAFASCSLLPSRASGADADGFLGEAAERYRGEPRERRRRPRRRGLRRRRRRGLLERARARKGRARSFGHQVSRGSDRAARGGGSSRPKNEEATQAREEGGERRRRSQGVVRRPGGLPGNRQEGRQGKGDASEDPEESRRVGGSQRRGNAAPRAGLGRLAPDRTQAQENAEPGKFRDDRASAAPAGGPASFAHQ